MGYILREVTVAHKWSHKRIFRSASLSREWKTLSTGKNPEYSGSFFQEILCLLQSYGNPSNNNNKNNNNCYYYTFHKDKKSFKIKI